MPVLKHLISEKADTEVSDCRGVTPLILAAVLSRSVIVQALLDAKAKIEAADNYGCTPLIAAAKGGYFSVVKLLLDAKANIKTKYKCGQTAVTAVIESFGISKALRLMEFRSFFGCSAGHRGK